MNCKIDFYVITQTCRRVVYFLVREDWHTQHFELQPDGTFELNHFNPKVKAVWDILSTECKPPSLTEIPVAWIQQNADKIHRCYLEGTPSIPDPGVNQRRIIQNWVRHFICLSPRWIERNSYLFVSLEYLSRITPKDYASPTPNSQSSTSQILRSHAGDVPFRQV